MNVDSGSGAIMICPQSADLTAEESDRSQSAEPSGDEDYFRVREQEERAAAKTAASTFARAIHQELAQFYGRLARQPDPAK